MNPFNSLANVKFYALRNLLIQLLDDQANPHMPIMERVSASLTTQQDVEDFMKLEAAIFQAGYLRSVQDHEKALAAIGIKANVTAPGTMADNSMEHS